jgi:hypothetical protein
MPDDRGVHNGIEFFHPRKSRVPRRSERQRSQACPVDAAVGIQNLPSEAPYYFLIYRLSRLHQLMRNVVSPDQLRTQFDEHLAHN